MNDFGGWYIETALSKQKVQIEVQLGAHNDLVGYIGSTFFPLVPVYCVMHAEDAKAVTF